MSLVLCSSLRRSLLAPSTRESGFAKHPTQHRSKLVGKSATASSAPIWVYKAGLSSVFTRRQELKLPRRAYFTTTMLKSSLSGFNENAFEDDVSGYQAVVTQTMKELQEKFEELEELDLEGYEVNEKDGVFELKLGELGTYVINKQAPNKQLWWSSPVSGPKRYNYDVKMKAWRNSRDGHLMYDLINEEITSLVGQNFDMYTVAARPTM